MDTINTYAPIREPIKALKKIIAEHFSIFFSILLKKKSKHANIKMRIENSAKP
jgi:hypothetical protein